MHHVLAFEVSDCANEHDMDTAKCPVSFRRFGAIYRGHPTGGMESYSFHLAHTAAEYGNPDIDFLNIMNF